MATATALPPGRNGSPRTVHPARRQGASPAAGASASTQATSVEIPLLVGREEGGFIVYEDVPVWTEHYSKAIGERFSEDDLHRIAAKCNQRIEDTGDYALLTVRHTKDDPDSEPPPVVGMAGPFHVGTFGNKSPKPAIFARFACYKEDREVVRRHPRVSVEYAYTKRDPKGGYFDVISLLGAEAPELDLGLRYAKRLAADPELCIGRYSRTVEFVDPDEARISGQDGGDEEIARYAAEAMPGGSNAYVPGGGGGLRKPKGKKGKPASSPDSSARHSRIDSGDGSKSTTSSASGAKDIVPSSQQGGPSQGGSDQGGSGHGSNGQGATVSYGDQRGSLSRVDISQIVAAMLPSIEESIRRIIPAPQPPPIENSSPDGDHDSDGDGLDIADDDADSDPDSDSDFDVDALADDAEAGSQGSSSKHAGGTDAGGRDASASAPKTPPAGKKRPPKKERFSMSDKQIANQDDQSGSRKPSDAIEIARYKKQISDLASERDKAVAERDEYRAKYEKTNRESSDKGELIEQLKSRVDAIDAERRYNARYAKLMAIQNDGYKLDLEAEAKDCAAMNDDEFSRHESRIKANYQRIPVTMLPMDRPTHIGSRSHQETEISMDERAKYDKQARSLVYRARQDGKQLEYLDAIRQVYQEAGKTMPGAVA